MASELRRRAILFFLIGHGTLHWAEQIVPSGVAALLVATEPLWIAMLMPARLGPRFSSKMIAGLASGLMGVGTSIPSLPCSWVGCSRASG